MSITARLGEERTVDLPAGTIAYRERGEGPPVVFVHGVGVNGDLWRNVAPELASDHRCIVPDLPFGPVIGTAATGVVPLQWATFLWAQRRRRREAAMSQAQA